MACQNSRALLQSYRPQKSWPGGRRGWNDWVIGDLSNIGTEILELKSYGDQGDRSPSDVPNDEWIRDCGDIIVQCVNDKGKIIFITLESSNYNALVSFCFLRLH